MRSNIVIGIVAQAGHGKDTVAQILRGEFSFHRLALADELKSDIYENFPGFPECSLDAQNSRDRAPWVRRLQQVYGTEWCRNRLGEDYWLERWGEEAHRRFEAGAKGISVPDIRFPNELSWLRDTWGALIVFLDRPGYQEPGVDPNHGSERYVSSLREKADLVIVNDGSVEDLRLRVVEGVRALLS